MAVPAWRSGTKMKGRALVARELGRSNRGRAAPARRRYLSIIFEIRLDRENSFPMWQSGQALLAATPGLFHDSTFGDQSHETQSAYHLRCAGARRADCSRQARARRADAPAARDTRASPACTPLRHDRRAVMNSSSYYDGHHRFVRDGVPCRRAPLVRA